MKLWEVVGGVDKGGILVRTGRELSSPKDFRGRLSTAAVLEELEFVGERLHYRLLTGSGPELGWISVAVSDKVLARCVGEPFAGRWKDNQGASVLIDGATMRGLGGVVLKFTVEGLDACSLSVGAEAYKGQLTKGGRLVWSDGAVWIREQDLGAGTIADSGCAGRVDDYEARATADERSPPSPQDERAQEAAPPTTGRTLPARGSNGRRPPPRDALSPHEAIEWILDSIDEFEAMLLPLRAVDEGEVKKRYRQLLLLVHPDKNQDPRAAEAFRTLFTAFGVLADPMTQERALRRAQRSSWQTGDTTDSGRAANNFNDDTHTGWDFSWLSDPVSAAIMTIFQQPNADAQERALFEQSEKMKRQGYFKDQARDGEDALWIEPKDAKRLMDNDDAVFVDARDVHAYMISHIPGAQMLPADNLIWLGDFESTLAVIKALESSPTMVAIVYSDNGSPLSRCGAVARAIREMLHDGKAEPDFAVADQNEPPSNLSSWHLATSTESISASLPFSDPALRVRRLTYGLNAWKRSGLPVDGNRNAFFGHQMLGATVAKLRPNEEEREERSAMTTLTA